MAVITVRNIPDPTKEALRIKAALAGVSLEQYLRTILEKASREDSQETRSIMEIASLYFVPTSLNSEENTLLKENALDLPERTIKRPIPTFK